MTGRKTHEQQQRIIDLQEVTKGGGDRFPAEEDLKASRGLRDSRADAGGLKTPAKDLADPDMLRGRNQP